MRLPAQTLEEVVQDALIQCLEDERQWIKLIEAEDLTSTDYQRIGDQVTRLRSALSEKQASSKRDAFRSLIYEISVAPGELAITYSKGAFNCSDVDQRGTPGYVQRIPFQSRRRGIETKIILGGNFQSTPKVDQHLIDAVSRSFAWWCLISTGEGWTVQQIADQEKIDASDVTRFFPLAFLAPDIVEAILLGSQPPDLSLEKIKKMGRLPIEWEQQRTLLGF